MEGLAVPGRLAGTVRRDLMEPVNHGSGPEFGPSAPRTMPRASLMPTRVRQQLTLVSIGSASESVEPV